MTKPISEADIFSNVCPNCKCQTYFLSHLFYCNKNDLGLFNEACTIEDWKKCVFHKISSSRISNYPPCNAGSCGPFLP